MGDELSRSDIRRRRCAPPGLTHSIGEVGLSEQVQLVCPGNGFGPVACAQLAIGVRDVTLDSGQADKQMISDLLVPHSVRYKAQDLDLPSCWRLGETR